MNGSCPGIRMLCFLLTLVIAIGFPFSLTGQPWLDDTDATFVPNELILLLDEGSRAPAPEAVVDAINRRRPVPGGLGIGNPAASRFVISERAPAAARDLLSDDPEAPEALLQRYVVLTFPAAVDLDKIAEALERNPHVLWVGKNWLMAPSATEPNDPFFNDNPNGVARPPEAHQWGSYSLRLPEAWDYTKGHSYVAIVDTGIDTDHPDFRPFDGWGTFLGGNFRPHLSWDYGQDDGNVDEGQAQGSLTVSFAGHGTHVSGIVGATPNNSTGTAGACWNCSLLVSKVSTVRPDQVNLGIAVQDVIDGIHGAIGRGAQVLNLSLGYRPGSYPNCATTPLDPFCVVLELLDSRDAVMTAAAGNDGGQASDFPAVDPRVIGVGGIEPDGSFWSDCPGFECGSNVNSSQILTPAKQIYSTFYAGLPYAPTNGCSDSVDGTVDGYGLCTGTSMSSPYAAGISGILRSINPLLDKSDIKALLTSNVENPAGWNPANGVGKPNVRAAVEGALGKANNVVLTNRLTPLFVLYSWIAEDHFYTTFPQMGSAAYWSPSGYGSTLPVGGALDVPGYGYFPGAGCQVGPCQPEPRASVFLFTTDRSPLPQVPLVPLYRMSWESPTNQNKRDHAYVTSKAEIESYAAAGYRLDGIEGYIYQPCSPEPSCIPPGAVRLYRRYNEERRDSAIFPESELANMTAAGYTHYAGNSWIGYAYPNVDSDSDHVVDGFETALLKTDPQRADSDCDGSSDGAEALNHPYTDPLGSPGCALPKDAVCTVQSVPASLQAGRKYPVTVTCQNTGTQTWSPIGAQCNAYRLGAANPYDNLTWLPTTRVDLPAPVPPGGQATLNFTITAPATPGTYNFQWRMVHECVTWFGGFTPNLQLTVQPAPAKDAQILSQTVPAIMTAGRKYAVSLRLRNVGTQAWSPVGPQGGAYRLGSTNPYDNTTWLPTNRVDLPATVPPGGEVTLDFTVTAPSTPGTYNFQWRMVHEWVAWFGDLSPNVAVTVQPAPAKDAQILSQSVPASMTAGQSYPVSIRVRNVGTQTWSPVGPQMGAYRLGSANPYNNGTWVPLTRVELPAPLAPGGEVTLNFTVTAPTTPGTYNFQWRMVHESIAWFGDFTPNVAVSVSP